MEDIVVKINEAAVKFLEPLTPEETYTTVINEAISLMDGVYGSVILEIDGELKRVYGSMPFTYTIRNRKRANTYRSFKENKVIVADITKAHPEIKKYGIKWTIFLPLSYQNKSIGVLTINTKKDLQYNKTELDSFKLFGSLASLAIKKTQHYNEIKKTLEVRDFFIALAAQELRTPLTTINGYIELLKKKLKAIDSPELKWINHLSQESKRLTDIVHELLEVNKVKAGKLQYALQEFHIKNIVERAMENIRFTYPNRLFDFVDKIKLKSATLVGDADKLMQVFINVLDNAAKFSPPSTPITISLSNTQTHAIVRINDHGAGISKKDLPYIFEGMYKPDYNQEHGMVIGLFIAKNIIEHHHGSIAVKSQKKVGTTVEIKLPLMKI